jgi:GLPGLI family protein
MTQKKKTPILFIFMASVFLYHQSLAQQALDNVQYKFFYQYSWQFDTITYNDIREDLIILQVGQNISKSFSYYTFQSDSLLATSGGERILRQIASRVAIARLENREPPKEFIRRRTPTKVYKNYPFGKVTVTDAISNNYYIYIDELHPQSWEILDSVKTILDYPVQMAVSYFRGRRWTAWFAPDIPISDGPWKLSGLPGLIMEAYDAKKHHSFNIVGIEKVDDEPIVFSPVVLSYGSFGKHEETNRIAFLRGLFRYLHNMPDIMNAQLGRDTFDSSSASNRPHDFIERDYR